jgi:hypothetical protein
MILAVQFGLRANHSVARTVCAFFLAAGIAAADNSVVLKDQTGTAQTAGPVTISRVFKQGEIPQFPRPSVSGTVLTQWQANVMNRWPDGSAKHALITFSQAIPAGGTVTVLFQNDPNPCHLGNQAACDSAAPSQSQILAFDNGNWGAQMQVTQGNTVTADARTMIGNGAWSFWVKGPLMNQIIVEDRNSSTLAYDFGWRDKRWFRITSPAMSTDSTISVDNAKDIAAASMPTIVQLDSEQIQICSVSGNTLNICPNGHGYNGSGAANHSAGEKNPFAALAYPNGSWRPATESQYKSLHPIFVLTQYTGWPGVKEEFILENPWSDKLQSQDYNLALKNGPGTGATPYTKNGIIHTFSTRWRKTFWDGAQPGSMTVDFNLPYMTSTGAVPNWDTSIKLDTTTSGCTANGCVADAKKAWAASDKGDIFGVGIWDPFMGDYGGRPDLGMQPSWYIWSLYAPNDVQLSQIAMGQAEVSGYVKQAHIRESETNRWYDSAQTVNAFGHEISIVGRPGVEINMAGFGVGSDALVAIGNYDALSYNTTPQAMTNYEPAHVYNMAYIPYLLTGDWYFLDEINFVAADVAATSYPVNNSRGANGSWGWMHWRNFEIRGQGEAFYWLGQAAFIDPDSYSAERTYSRQILDNYIAMREGQLNIQNGIGYNDPVRGAMWKWTNGYYYYQKGTAYPNPLGITHPAMVDGDWDGLTQSLTCITLTPFEEMYQDLFAGALERDFGLTEIHALRQALSPYVIDQMADTNARWYVNSYRTAGGPNTTGTSSCPGTGGADTTGYGTPNPYYTSFSQTVAANTATIPGVQSYMASQVQGDAQYAYAYIARAAASYTYEFTTPAGNTGSSAWNWIYSQANVTSANSPAPNDGLSQDPKWSLLPRSIAASTTISGPPSASRCDLNGDGQLTAADVDLAVAQVNNPGTCKTADLDQNSTCNIVDVQMLINAVNSQSCPF